MERSNLISGSSISVLTLTVAPGAADERLDSYLTSQLPDLTRSQIKRLINEGLVVTAEGRRVKGSQRIKSGEMLRITIPEPEPIEAVSEEIPLNILFEDNSLIVIDKPAGMVVHPAAGHARGTLVNALLFHCKDLAGVGGKLRPGIVHRLDKGTSGVMLATKNDNAHHVLSAQFKKHSIKRKYKAIVHGTPDQEGTIDLPLGRDPKDRKKISVRESGRRAVTHWKVLKSYQGLSLLELMLETGRTHQIRVHLSKEGHPIVGDPVYGNSKRAKEIRSTIVRSRLLSIGRQALHAFLLGFIHPVTGDYMEFTSPLPQDMADLLQVMEDAA